MRFVAIDVETANPRIDSICQIAVVSFAEGCMRECWHSLVDPEDRFDPFNISIHGIDSGAVRGQPSFPQLYRSVRERMENAVVVCHTHFDRVAVTRVLEKYEMANFECRWLDSARVARRAWPEFSQRGYGLANVAASLGIVYDPHDAREDARAAGEVFVQAMRETGLGIEEWFDRIRKPIYCLSGRASQQSGNPDGPLSGETVVFTGSLSMPRRMAAQLALEAGCDVATRVGSNTTLLVVGDQDLRRLTEGGKSSKQRKAEALISIGQPIQILTEGDFVNLLGLRG